MRYCKVVRGTPNRAAAPFSPLSTPGLGQDPLDVLPLHLGQGHGRHRGQALAGLEELLDFGAADGFAGPQNEQPLDQVLELAHVARPGMLLELLHGLGAVKGRLAVGAPGLEFREPPDEQRDVFAPLAQGRQAQGHRVQAVEQVGAELFLQHRVLEVAVGGGDDPEIHLDGPAVAHPLKTLVLQNVQQFGLQMQRQFADLVQQQAAALGHLEASHPLTLGPGKGALGVAEQLALEQAGR